MPPYESNSASLILTRNSNHLILLVYFPGGIQKTQYALLFPRRFGG